MNFDIQILLDRILDLERYVGAPLKQSGESVAQTADPAFYANVQDNIEVAADFTEQGLVGTKQVDESAIGDEKIIVYHEASGKFEYEVKPGAGTFSGTMDDITDGSTYVKTHNDFTDALETKLTGIATGAEVNVNADWNASSGDAQILNKPSLLALGVSATDAYYGDKGKVAYDHSQAAHAPANATNGADWNTNLSNIPATFPPSSHTHDDRYYTESEMNTLLNKTLAMAVALG